MRWRDFVTPCGQFIDPTPHRKGASIHAGRWQLRRRPPQHSLYICCEPEPLTLLGPSERHGTKEALQGQPAGLPTFGDRFHDIRGKVKQVAGSA